MLSIVQFFLAFLSPIVNVVIGPVTDLPITVGPVADLPITIGPVADPPIVADLLITNKVIDPDLSGFSRPAILTNGTFPGVLIKGNKGDRFELTVQNQLNDARLLTGTSIHWHGLFQRGSAWADGPVGVSQCPIPSNSSFLYDFNAIDQAGTFWYHSHYSTQYCDGLRGPFIIYDPDEDAHGDKYDVDDESTIITLADWYHAPAREGPMFPNSDATMINGKGRWGLNPIADLSAFTVKNGTKYRFRLISLSCDSNYEFSIDGHDLTIIEVDGVDIEPHPVQKLTIYAGQRYSFVLNANHTIDNYWIRALPNFQNIPQRYEHGVNSAILRYEGAKDVDPTTSEWVNATVLNEADLRPLVVTPAVGRHELGAADYNLTLNMAWDNRTDHKTFSINGISFVPPPMPILLQILSKTHTAQDLLPPGTFYELERNKVVELTIPALPKPGGPHPMHLHGHLFQVIRSAGSDKVNWDNPIARDVVSSGMDGSIVIRFTTDNPGPWILHCHIDWHLERGLAMVFAESVPDIKVSKPPTAWRDLCPPTDTLSAGEHQAIEASG